ncbi:short-chain dehydrogenase [Aureimonas endophytica]|uniref:Short-chain dehydrogenase n=1 Tax=Aureimonas endophytica TaxID=2027858 RepID=A0A917A470_9HYPH|nr:SDR family oxidoreductase [Aureimonas endophytica]GGE25035.1 short-chain dehydrogenase [Aureimonas endophytica]
MKTAFITGATSGIGRATAIALAEAGYEVFATGRNAAALDGLRDEHPSIRPLAADVSDREAMESIVADLRVDVLINNAGVMPPLGNFADMALADIDTALEVNVSSAILLTRAVIGGMRSRGSGHVLFVGSSAAHAAFPNVAVYSATKAAIAGFAAALRADVSPFGIRVTEIVPGRVETQLYKSILDADARAAMYAGGVALQPEDVAAMIVAVLSLPERADVTRFDIMPTRPTTPSGSMQGSKS